MSVGEIADYLGVDSLAYLDLERLITATGSSPAAFCTACFTGEYPTDVPEGDTKHALELDADSLTVPHAVPGEVGPRADRT
jgi:amidophosphoribosyltransferase